ncbi:MAG: hypothetical protein JWR84_3361 [Caulobacter sp.]|nr:hypothetical protein [Caulobacter sp.]
MTLLKRTILGLIGAAALASCGKAETKAVTKPDEQAVIVSIKLSDAEFGASGESFALYPLEDAMEARVKADGTGDLDGHEIGGGYFTVYFYGKNAEALWRSASAALPRTLPAGSYATVRLGPPGAPSRRVDLPLPPS